MFRLLVGSCLFSAGKKHYFLNPWGLPAGLNSKGYVWVHCIPLRSVASFWGPWDLFFWGPRLLPIVVGRVLAVATVFGVRIEQSEYVSVLISCCFFRWSGNYWHPFDHVCMIFHLFLHFVHFDLEHDAFQRIGLTVEGTWWLTTTRAAAALFLGWLRRCWGPINVTIERVGVLPRKQFLYL